MGHRSSVIGHWRRRFARLTLIFLFWSAGQLVSRSAVFGQNILLFTIDSCRADRIRQDLAPNIIAWSRTGTFFTNAYSTSAWTAPGLVSILTGLYPATHGISNRDHMGSPDLVTLMKVFRDRAYQVPNLNFFTFAPYYKNLGLPGIQQEYFGQTPGDELINWLSTNAGAEAKPFFVWYHTTLIHQPYNPRPEDLPAPREELMKSPGIKAVMTGAIVPVGSTQFSPDDRPVLDRLYNAEVRRVDALFKRALDALREKKLLQDTLIILTADHGEELLDHGFVGHASTSLEAKLFQELIRIPLVVSWPGKVPSGVARHAVNQTDIFPTVLRLFEIEIPNYIQGRDLFKGSANRPLFLESVVAGNQTTKEREHLWLYGMLKGRHKLISRPSNTDPSTLPTLDAAPARSDPSAGIVEELYDLSRDPLEQRNIAKAHPKLVSRLKFELEGWQQEATRLREKIFPSRPEVYLAASSAECPRIFTPGNGETLNYDIHTGMVLFDWSGDKETTYLIEYDIGTGDHHVAGTYEVKGNHQLLGPLTRELWENLKAWNPFKFRVAPKSDKPCWSEWVTFQF